MSGCWVRGSGSSALILSGGDKNDYSQNLGQKSHHARRRPNCGDSARLHVATSPIPSLQARRSLYNGASTGATRGTRATALGEENPFVPVDDAWFVSTMLLRAKLNILVEIQPGLFFVWLLCELELEWHVFGIC